MKAEYIAATLVAYQAMRMCHPLADIEVPQRSTTILHYDNLVVIAIAKNPAQH